MSKSILIKKVFGNSILILPTYKDNFKNEK